jgi:hypothetical protein
MKILVKVRAFSPMLRLGAVLPFEKAHLDLSLECMGLLRIISGGFL